MGAGMRIAVELVAAVLVGAAIGIALDKWLGTQPWLLILFFVLGCGAGLRNVYRAFIGDAIEFLQRMGQPFFALPIRFRVQVRVQLGLLPAHRKRVREGIGTSVLPRVLGWDFVSALRCCRF